MPGLFVGVNANEPPHFRCLASENNHFAAQFVRYGAVSLALIDFPGQLKRNIIQTDTADVTIYIHGNCYFDECTRQLSPSAEFSDLLLESYKKMGTQVLSNLSGSYCLAIHDMPSQKTIIATDRLSSKPLYYREYNQTVLICSEIKGVLDRSRGINYNKQGIYELFSFSHPLGTKTLLEGIMSFPPATSFEFNHLTKTHKMSTYWSYAKVAKGSRPVELQLAFETFAELLKTSIMRRIEEHDSIGIFLSGGIDSRILAAYANELCHGSNKTLTLFTFGTKEGVQDTIAKKVAASLNVCYRFFEIPSNTIATHARKLVWDGDGHFRIRDGHFISVFPKLPKNIDVFIAGYMADTLFGGHIEQTAEKMLSREEIVQYILSKFVVKEVINKIALVLPQATVSDIMEFAKDSVKSNLPAFDLLPAYKLVCYWDLCQRGPRYMAPISNYGNWYVPVADPFIDNDIIDFAINLPFERLAKKRFLIGLLAEKWPHLYDIQFERATAKFGSGKIRRFYETGIQKTSRLAKRTIQRLSAGRILFTNKDYKAYDYWLRTDSKGFVTDVLSNSGALSDFNFDEGGINRLLRDHIRCKSDNNQIICDLMNLILLAEHIGAMDGSEIDDC